MLRAGRPRGSASTVGGGRFLQPDPDADPDVGTNRMSLRFLLSLSHCTLADWEKQADNRKLLSTDELIGRLMGMCSAGPSSPHQRPQAERFQIC